MWMAYPFQRLAMSAASTGPTSVAIVARHECGTQRRLERKRLLSKKDRLHFECPVCRHRLPASQRMMRSMALQVL